MRFMSREIEQQCSRGVTSEMACRLGSMNARPIRVRGWSSRSTPDHCEYVSVDDGT